MTDLFKIPLARRALLGGASASLASLAFSGARAAPTLELKFASISSPNHVLNRVLHQQWIKAVESETGGKLKITLFPGGTLGNAKQAYDVALSGIADISYGWTIYYPGRFPRTEALTLPGAVPNIAAAHRSFDVYEKYLQPDWSQVKLLWLGVAAGYMLTSREKPIKVLNDVKSMKLGTIGNTAASVAKTLGATPIDITAQNAYLALQRKVVDGFINTWPSVAANKYGEVANYFTDTSLFNSVFFCVMNKRKYEALPADIRAAIDKHSANHAAFDAATDAYWNDDAEAKKQVLAQTRGKGAIFSFADGEMAKYRALVKPMWSQWSKAQSARGIPADAILKMMGNDKA